MSLHISFQPMRVLIDGHDSEGRLVLADDQLAAVLVRLDGMAHSLHAKSKWHLEAGFGRCAVPPGVAPLWSRPEEARTWVEERLTSGRAHQRRKFA